nr:MAG TPA: hypothetical protein [Caudoviricetes sp.]
MVSKKILPLHPLQVKRQQMQIKLNNRPNVGLSIWKSVAS